MSKRFLTFISFALLLMACHSAKSSPTAEKLVPTAETAVTDTQYQAQPKPQLQPTQPEQTTVPAQTKPAQPAQAKEQQDLGKKEVLPEDKPAFLIPQTPAADRAVFEDEELIDFSDRSLHPYAGLIPDVNAEQKAPWAYEQLKYGIYYSFVKAGTAYIRNRGLVNINGRKAYLLQTTAFSAPVIDAVFKVRDVNQSWLDAEGIFSLGYGQSVREGRYIRDEWITFDYAAKQYTGQSKKKKEPKQIQGPLDIKVLDMLSSLYYVRSQKLEVGKDLVFDIVNRSKQYPLLVKVLKKEKVKTKAGTFNTILVEPQIRGEGIFVSKGKSLKVWVTDDKYKMPVKMTVEVFIGSVSAELLDYQRQSPENIL